MRKTASERTGRRQAMISCTTSPGNVGQAEVAAGVTVGEPLVVEAEQVQDRGVQVVHVDAVLDGAEAELVGGAVDVPPFTPPPASHMVKP